MPSYLPAADYASPVTAGWLAGAAVPPAGMVAFRAGDLLACPGTGPGGRRGAVVAGSAAAAGAAATAGTLMTFCHPVVTVPAVVRGGAVLADGWLPDFARLGELERHLGDGVIEELAGRAVADGRVPAPERRRIMSLPLTMRLIIAIAIMPDASGAEALRRVAGLLPGVPWARDWHVPTGKVITIWRVKVPPSVMEELFWTAAGPLAGDDSPSAFMLAGLPVCGIDGVVVNVADTPANRRAFGPDGGPFPQIRVVAVTARAGRAVLGAIPGGSRAGEQALLARLIRRRPELFRGRVFCFDRNFPGHKIITAILDAGGHVVARLKDNIAVPVTEDGWLDDGSRMTWLNAPGGKKAGRLPIRVAEHNAVLPCGDGDQVSETFTLATTLLDHREVPAEALRQAYLARWSASETTFGEDKTTITGAGDRTSGPVLRSGTPRLVIQEAWAWLTGTQLIRASAAASLTSQEAAPRALRRRETSGPVTTDQVSFTTARHNAIRTMTQTMVTAATTLGGLAALADATSRDLLHTLITTGRDRHSAREQKARPKFPHTAITKTTVKGTPEITRFGRPPQPRQASSP